MRSARIAPISLEIRRSDGLKRWMVKHAVIIGGVILALVTPAQAGQKARAAWEAVARIEEIKAQKLLDTIVLMGLKDDVNRIAVARGSMSSADADAQLTAYGKKIYVTPFGAGEIAAARADLLKSAADWLDQIGHDAAASNSWPGGGSGDWQKIAQRELGQGKGNLAIWLSQGLDPAPLLDSMVRIQGWTRGNLKTPSPFADHQARIVAALGSSQAREMLAKAMGIKPANPPSPPARNLAPVTVFGVTGNSLPAPGGTSGGRPVPGETGISHPTTASPIRPATGTGGTNVPQAPPLGSWHNAAAGAYVGRGDVRSLFGSDVAALGQEGMEFNVDRPGSDLTSFDLDRADPRICRQACRQGTSCKAFTFVRPGAQGPHARCWLKSAIPTPVTSTCCVSGKP